MSSKERQPTITSATSDNRFWFYFEHVKWQQLVAGVVSGLVTTSLLHPLDLAKIRLQVNEGNRLVSSRPVSSKLIGTLREIYQSWGFRGFYQGVTPNLLGSATAWGFYFFIYGAFKNYAQGGDTSKILSTLEYLSLAATSGSIVLWMTNPIWVTKTRMCLQYEVAKGDFKTPLLTTWGTLSSIWKLEGFRGLYRGMVPGLIGVSNGALQFLLYEQMRNTYNGKYRKRRIDTHLNVPEYLTCGTVSKAVAVAMTYPYQVVRTRLQERHRQHVEISDLIRTIFRREGTRGFYKGLLPNILRTAPACGLTFVVYEHCYRWLQSPLL